MVVLRCCGGKNERPGDGSIIANRCVSAEGQGRGAALRFAGPGIGLGAGIMVRIAVTCRNNRGEPIVALAQFRIEASTGL